MSLVPCDCPEGHCRSPNTTVCRNGWDGGAMLSYLRPGIAVLRDICGQRGLTLGEAKAAEMLAEIDRAMPDQTPVK